MKVHLERTWRFFVARRLLCSCWQFLPKAAKPSTTEPPLSKFYNHFFVNGKCKWVYLYTVITKKKGNCMIYSQYFQSETTSRPTHSADDTFNSSQYERKGPLHRLRLLPFYLGTWMPVGRFVSCEVQLSLGINLPLPFHQKAARQRAYVQAA